MTEIRKCVAGWANCDGKYYTCGTEVITTTGETIVIKSTVPASQMETIHYPQVSGITPYAIKDGEKDAVLRN